ISLSYVDHVAINHDSSANLVGKLYYVLAQRPDPRLMWSRWKNRRARVNVAGLLRQNVSSGAFDAPVHPVEHHAAHLSSAFHVSPFEQAVVVSLPWFSEFVTAALAVSAT